MYALASTSLGYVSGLREKSIMTKTPNSWKKEEEQPSPVIKHRMLEGLPVVDAKAGLLIQIKKCDILGSTKADPNNCAAARALRREYGSEARVYLTRTYVKTGKVWGRFITPASIAREIVAFDRGASFEPGEYVLNPPPKTLRLDYKKKPTGPKKDKNGKSNKPRHVTASVRQMR
jgi:hypothetical protein